VDWFSRAQQAMISQGWQPTVEGTRLVFAIEEHKGNGLTKYSDLYYGELHSVLEGGFALDVYLRGYDFAGTSDVSGKLHAIDACMQAVVENRLAGE